MKTAISLAACAFLLFGLSAKEKSKKTEAMATTTKHAPKTTAKGKTKKKLNLSKDPALLAARKKIWLDPKHDFTGPTLPVK